MWTEITRPQYERPDLRYASDLTNKERELYSLATYDGFSRNADAQHVTIAITDMQGLLRGKYVSRNKLLLVLESGWGVAPLTLALGCDVDYAAPSAIQHVGHDELGHQLRAEGVHGHDARPQSTVKVPKLWRIADIVRCP